MAGPAAAQMLSLPPPRQPLPVTVKLFNKATNEPIGTATYSDSRVYFRDKDGTHYATVVVAPDGTRTTYDPHGKIIK